MLDGLIPDFLILLLLAAGAITYFVGRKQNERVAVEWLRNTVSIWESNFALVETTNGRKLTRDNAANFFFYASGRVHCESLLGRISLQSRHDLFQIAKNYVTTPKFDKITFEVALNARESSSFVFALVSNAVKDLCFKEHYGIRTFCSTRSSQRVPTGYVCSTDAPEFFANLFEAKEIFQTVQKLCGDNPQGIRYLEELIVSDQPTWTPRTIEEANSYSSKTLTITFRLPENDEALTFEFTACVVQLIDFIAEKGGLLSSDSVSKLKRARDSALQVVSRKLESQRKEELQQKKVDAKKAEEERVSTLPKEEQRKWEEKERKKALKKDQKKKMKKGKMMIAS